MTRRNTNAAARADNHRDAAPLAANASEGATEKVASIDALAEEVGAADPTLSGVAFLGYDEAAGLEAGQGIASERILSAVPVFVASVRRVWGALSKDRRDAIIGFTPDFVTVLVHEARALQRLNDRYDRGAYVTTAARTRSEALAAAALREGRDLRDRVMGAAERFVPEGERAGAGLVGFDAGSADAEVVARSIAGLAAWLCGWRAAMPEAQRALVASMGLNDAQVASLAAAARSIRTTQASLALVLDERNVTQRELDTQDGRVIHVVGLMFGAFRDAARRDPTLPLPDLGELHSHFVRADHRPRKSPTKPA